MKALSVRQPYAELIARGVKTLEIRSWAADYRGPLLICASSNAWREDYDAYDLDDGDCPIGIAVCVVDLVGVEEMTPTLERIRKRIDKAALCSVPIGHYLWMLERPRRTWAAKVKGKVRLFDVAAQELLPPRCAASMGCLCAGHARGNASTAACDTREQP